MNTEAFAQQIASRLGFDPRPLVQRALQRGWITLPPPTHRRARTRRCDSLPEEDDALVYGAENAAALAGVSSSMLRAVLPGVRVAPHLKAWRAGELRALAQQRRGEIPADDNALVFGARVAAALAGVTEEVLRAAVPGRRVPRYGLAWRAGDLRRFKAVRARANDESRDARVEGARPGASGRGTSGRGTVPTSSILTPPSSILTPDS